jgi:hypothetical protein
MAHWDSKKGRIIYWPDKPSEEWPGWDELDCGCCGGIQWSGDYPKECDRCGGGGTLFRHRKSGALADYPGGPFRGKETRRTP